MTVVPSNEMMRRVKVITAAVVEAKRAAAVGANVVYGVELSVDVEYSDGLAADLQTLAAAGFDIACFTNLYKIGHSRFLS